MASNTTHSGFTIARPAAGPTAVADTVSGNLDPSAVYQYKVTYVTAFGESDGNLTATTISTTSTGSIALSGIAVSPDGNVTQRKIYRTVGGGASFLLLVTLDDNSTSVYSDIKSDSDLGAAIPSANTAHSRQTVLGILKVSRPTIYSLASGITAFASGGQANAVQLTEEYNILSVVATAGDSVKLPELSANLIGMHVLVANDGANSANIFPAVGQDASGGTNTAVAVAAAARAEFIAKSSSAWEKTR